MVYEPRTYRRAVDAGDLVSFEVVVAETDLQVMAARDLSAEATRATRRVRGEIEGYIGLHPRFGESFVPVPVEPVAPVVVRAMAQAAQAAGVGPMAAVAGAIAESVARELAGSSDEVVVENGGDLFVMGRRERTVGLWAGEAGAKGIGLVLAAALLPIAVATSSGTIGPSVSLGRADTATIVAGSGALADAAASAVGNRVRSAGDIEAALQVARDIEGVLGAVVSIHGDVGAWGAVRLVPVDLVRRTATDPQRRVHE